MTMDEEEERDCLDVAAAFIPLFVTITTPKESFFPFLFHLLKKEF